MRFVLPLLLLTACLGDGPAKNTPRPEPPKNDPSASTSEPVTLGSASAMLGDSPDAGAAPNDMLQLPKPDLTGLIDCYGAAACDPASMICIKYLEGTTGNPGPPRAAPSCYAPADPCPNGVFDCACIQADPVLSMNCGVCIPNGNGTHTCYAS